MPDLERLEALARAASNVPTCVEIGVAPQTVLSLIAEIRRLNAKVEALTDEGTSLEGMQRDIERLTVDNRRLKALLGGDSMAESGKP